MKVKFGMNENAIREILDTYGDTVYKIAFSYCKNRSDAEDIYQEVFVKYFQHGEVFESNTHEKAWLIRVTINCSKSFLRSSWYKRVVPIDDKQEELVFIEENNDLLKAVLELPSKYREVIHLYYYEGYSTKEISSILSRKETTVRTQLQRGRDILKLKLKEELIYE
ncbi:sigma-70 family RNA polymerase sigma factor [Clostridium oryzae]|uniref:ECF RNA polymerase sigma factor SigW n=1 Tax=Clostridium oryzae TaxID=1450648 RepID=A0A1V4INE3_9CLOT|nr:sigma-70 family RNA polymerase sigma factor [Clostridium oryzae]OPJ61320.1 ECF RNA polymerase sigma factor SigW [Clostridium oryzae]